MATSEPPPPSRNNSQSSASTGLAEVRLHGTSPQNADTDGDGLSDFDEVNVHQTSPILRETDIPGKGGVVTRFYSLENHPKRNFRVRRNE